VARAALDTAAIDGIVFDMDGVVTDTASTHAAAWKRLFDEYLVRRASRTGEPFVPFDVHEDYLRFIDGKPRYNGVRDFLASRSIELPWGTASDPPDRDTICGLGNRKNDYFLERLRSEGTTAYPSTVAFVRQAQAAGLGTAIISASENMADVLAAAGIEDLFPVRVDGRDAVALGLPGKPEPAVFLEAARRMQTEPPRTAVVEDARAGVEAGRRGGFGLVIGVDRRDQGDRLVEAGADVVMKDLAEIEVRGPRP
jgi:alpha,alpha-trehalase